MYVPGDTYVPNAMPVSFSSSWRILVSWRLIAVYSATISLYRSRSAATSLSRTGTGARDDPAVDGPAVDEVMVEGAGASDPSPSGEADPETTPDMCSAGWEGEDGGASETTRDFYSFGCENAVHVLDKHYAPLA